MWAPCDCAAAGGGRTGEQRLLAELVNCWHRFLDDSVWSGGWPAGSSGAQAADAAGARIRQAAERVQAELARGGSSGESAGGVEGDAAALAAALPFSAFVAAAELKAPPPSAPRGLQPPAAVALTHPSRWATLSYEGVVSRQTDACLELDGDARTSLWLPLGAPAVAGAGALRLPWSLAALRGGGCTRVAVFHAQPVRADAALVALAFAPATTCVRVLRWDDRASAPPPPPPPPPPSLPPAAAAAAAHVAALLAAHVHRLCDSAAAAAAAARDGVTPPPPILRRLWLCHAVALVASDKGFAQLLLPTALPADGSDTATKAAANAFASLLAADAAAPPVQAPPPVERPPLWPMKARPAAARSPVWW